MNKIKSILIIIIGILGISLLGGCNNNGNNSRGKNKKLSYKYIKEFENINYNIKNNNKYNGWILGYGTFTSLEFLKLNKKNEPIKRLSIYGKFSNNNNFEHEKFINFNFDILNGNKIDKNIKGTCNFNILKNSNNIKIKFNKLNCYISFGDKVIEYITKMNNSNKTWQ